MEFDQSKKLTLATLRIPFAIVLLMWASKVAELYFSIRFAEYGIEPGTVAGLKGILFAPLIHGSMLEHLLPNTLPVIILSVGLYYFYEKLAGFILLWSWLITGLWTWAIGGPGFHIGASGLIYALASFIFFSGIMRKHKPLLALSMLVVFIYGGLVWGIFPYKPNISWESHLSGACTGLILALYYRKAGPQRKRYDWEREEDADDSAVDEQLYWQQQEDNTV